jgi:EmrB/QacA subfamily drug resistance transporter
MTALPIQPVNSSTAAATTGTIRYSSKAGRWILASTVLASAMATIDVTVVSIALPAIGRQFHSSLGTLQWVVSGYTLTLAAFLLPAGALADRVGRRRVFLIGVGWFTCGSALCSIAPTPTALIITRLVQGVGAALLTPGSLAIIEATFHPDDRSRTVGAWTGLSGVASAAGPLVGGYLIAVASWRWIFLINIPTGAVVLFLSSRHIPESRAESAQGNRDPLGAALAAIALAALVYGLIEGPTRGWTTPTILVSLTTGVVAGGLFVHTEKRSRSPMLPLHVFRIRQFSAANAVTFVVYGALGGALFLLPVMLQEVDHYTPLDSGVALLPLTAVMLVLSPQSGRLATRIGPRLQMTVGPILVATGLLLLRRGTTDPNYLTGVLPAVTVFALGLATTVAPLTTTALAALPDHEAGLASAVNNDVARLGSLIAVAVLPAAAGITGDAYLHGNQLAPGFRLAMIIAASWCALGGVLAGLTIRNATTAKASLSRSELSGEPARRQSSNSP